MVNSLHETRYILQRGKENSSVENFALCRSTVPTGYQTIPQDVLNAKTIREEITKRADIGDAEASANEHTEKFNDESAAFRSTSNEGTGSDGSFFILEGENRIPSIAVPSSTFNVTHSSRPLLRKGTKITSKQEEHTIIEALRTLMIQEQMMCDGELRQCMMDREEERLRREEERRFREEQRTEERERAEGDRRRSDRMMQLIILALLRKSCVDV